MDILMIAMMVACFALGCWAAQRIASADKDEED